MAALRISSDTDLQRIAIVNDEHIDVQISQWEVQAAGFEPLVIHRAFQKIEDLATFIQAEADGAICAHRLSRSALANFSGAALVACLYDLKVPAVLITQYADIDKDVSIRKWRDKIPVVLRPDEADADSIRQGLEACTLELQGHLSEQRRPYRVLIGITYVGVGDEAHEQVVDVIIPSWNPHRAVRFPASLIPSEFHESLVPEGWFFARVNIGADRPEDLYFREFEVAPEPDDNDGLA